MKMKDDSILELPLDYELPILEYTSISSHKDQIKSRVKRQLQFGDLSRLTLHVTEGQKKEGGINGFDLFKELKGQPVLPANLLYYFLKNPRAILKILKGKKVYFFGTIFYTSRAGACVHGLDKCGKHFVAGAHWLRNSWDINDHILILPGG